MSVVALAASDPVRAGSGAGAVLLAGYVFPLAPSPREKMPAEGRPLRKTVRKRGPMYRALRKKEDGGVKPPYEIFGLAV